MKHLEGSFTGYGDTSLYYQCWLPAGEPRAVLLVVHGLAEHSGRYMNLVNYFVPKGYAVYGFDQRGHGRSQGRRGYVGRFRYFVSDLVTFLGVVRRRHNDAKILIVGHSMGGTVATACAVEHQDGFDGLILSGVFLRVGADVSWGLITIARLLSLLLPQTGLYTIDASALSRDSAVVAAYVADPLVYCGKVRARLGAELVKMVKVLPSQIPRINLPILIMHGGADRLSPPEGSQILYERVGSKDKTLKLYRDFYHEIFNEPGNMQVFADMESWLAAHI